MNAVDQGAEFTSVDEEGLFTAVTPSAIVFVFREEPEANGYLRALEKLSRESDHAVYEVGVDDCAANVAFA